MRVLAGDVGGTKTALAIVEIGGRRCRVLRHERYHSADHRGLEEIVVDFLSAERGALPAAAGFGVAGPVRAGRARITNLSWRLDERRLSRRTGIRRVVLVNDFGANARGLRYLGPRQTATLARGRPDAHGPIALLGAGTGLGQAVLLRVDDRDVVVASEGGHVDFGPRTPVEDRLDAFLRRRFGRTTRERILSGSGLGLVYDFLLRDGAARSGPAAALEIRTAEDRAAAISRLGLAGRDPLARKALALFVTIYGSEAGNLALQYRATGGVFVAGGIAPKILKAMKAQAFLRSFRDKPPMKPLLADIPVRVVLDDNLGLYGAAAAAAARR
ncbi:MAG TPA: glucokinase [Thermoanaerobaculia bacterium]|nr:glucokinase [Thermoanaerobaculia bacterium]